MHVSVFANFPETSCFLYAEKLYLFYAYLYSFEKKQTNITNKKDMAAIQKNVEVDSSSVKRYWITVRGSDGESYG